MRAKELHMEKRQRAEITRRILARFPFELAQKRMRRSRLYFLSMGVDRPRVPGVGRMRKFLGDQIDHVVKNGGAISISGGFEVAFDGRRRVTVEFRCSRRKPIRVVEWIKKEETKC
jgi:hypothetical protein